MVNKKILYRINWAKLSNDKLLELWTIEAPAPEDVKIIEKILKARRVIRICPNEKTN